LRADEVLRVYVTLLEPEPLLTREKLLTELVPTGKTGEIVNGNEVLPVGIATFVMVIVAGNITALAVRARSCEPPPPPLKLTRSV
jgi:hypothetical protein